MDKVWVVVSSCGTIIGVFDKKPLLEDAIDHWRKVNSLSDELEEDIAYSDQWRAYQYDITFLNNNGGIEK